MSIFKDCDIRGVYGRELTDEDARKIGRGLCAMLPPGATVLVAGSAVFCAKDPAAAMAAIRSACE